MGAPQPIVVVSAQGRRQMCVRILKRSEKINRTGFAVVIAEDTDALLILGRERSIGLQYKTHLLLPTETIGVKLRKGTCGRVLLLAAMQAQRRGIAYPCGRWQYRGTHRQNDKAGDDQDARKDRKRHNAVSLYARGSGKAALPGYAARREVSRIDRCQVIVFCMKSHHHDKEDQKGNPQPAPVPYGSCPQQCHNTRNPEQRVHWLHIVELC